MLKYIMNQWDMGGYGIYIWPCYALLLTIITWHVYAAFKRSIQVRNNLKHDAWSGSNSDEQS